MKCNTLCCLVGLLNPVVAQAAPDNGAATSWWSSWRGPDGTGVAPTGNPPTTWSENKNIRWKVELATNQLDDGFDATAAIAGDELFLRGSMFLYCIAER